LSCDLKIISDGSKVQTDDFAVKLLDRDEASFRLSERGRYALIIDTVVAIEIYLAHHRCLFHIQPGVDQPELPIRIF
jgi:hypothetical protein